VRTHRGEKENGCTRLKTLCDLRSRAGASGQPGPTHQLVCAKPRLPKAIFMIGLMHYRADL